MPAFRNSQIFKACVLLHLASPSKPPPRPAATSKVLRALGYQSLTEEEKKEEEHRCVRRVATELGLPVEVVIIADFIAGEVERREGCTRSETFMRQFLTAIKPGADLSAIAQALFAKVCTPYPRDPDDIPSALDYSLGESGYRSPNLKVLKEHFVELLAAT